MWRDDDVYSLWGRVLSDQCYMLPSHPPSDIRFTVPQLTGIPADIATAVRHLQDVPLSASSLPVAAAKHRVVPTG